MKNWYKTSQKHPTDDYDDNDCPNNWYKYAQEYQEQQLFNFYNDIEQHDPLVVDIPPEFNGSNRSIETLEEAIEDVEGYENVAKQLNNNGFNWKLIEFPNDNIIAIYLDGETYIIDDFDFVGLEEANDWVNGIFDNDLYSYIPPEEEDDFWEGVGEGFTVYHATPNENLESIKVNGIEPRNQTRGITNRSTPSAVFTSTNPDEITSYGDTVFEINVSKMKEDGYMPRASLETPIEEENVRSQLAYKIGLENYENGQLDSDGISDSTLIFYDTIPTKYLSLI